MWTEVINQSDIDKLMNLYGGFHDSCLRDIYISTMEFVDEKLAMHFDNISTATLLFQRQERNNSVIELKFEDLDQFNYNPLKDNYSNVILDVTLRTEEGLFYWADFKD